MYQNFKNSVLNQGLITVQGITNPYGVECVTLGWAYAALLFPNESIKTTITLSNAKDVFANASSTYFDKIVNDVNNPNQVPQQGDIMVFNATPQAGYTNTFNNPDGHEGICDSANSEGYYLLQQNAPASGQAVNVTFYPWKFRPCIGWLRPISQAAPVVAPVSTPAPDPANQVEVAPFTPVDNVSPVSVTDTSTATATVTQSEPVKTDTITPAVQTVPTTVTTTTSTETPVVVATTPSTSIHTAFEPVSQSAMPNLVLGVTPEPAVVAPARPNFIQRLVSLFVGLINKILRRK